MGIWVNVDAWGGFSEIDATGAVVGDGDIGRWCCMKRGGTKSRANRWN